MKRREFIGWVGVGALASSLPVAIAACNSESEPPQSAEPKLDTSVREDGYQALATVAELEAKGSVVDQKSAAQSVLMFENPDTNSVAAINPMCTHQGCTVEWQPDDQIFACPCHGSKFKMDGEVIEGPANQPLATFDAKTEGDLVLVKVS